MFLIEETTKCRRKIGGIIVYMYVTFVVVFLYIRTLMEMKILLNSVVGGVVCSVATAIPSIMLISASGRLKELESLIDEADSATYRENIEFLPSRCKYNVKEMRNLGYLHLCIGNFLSVIQLTVCLMNAENILFLLFACIALLLVVPAVFFITSFVKSRKNIR